MGGDSHWHLWGELMLRKYKMKYSILPARITGEKRFRIGHLQTLVALGCFASKTGLVYCTVETIEQMCPSVQRETIKKCIKDLIAWGYLYKLQSKYLKNQKSKWLTNRYALVYIKDQKLPPYEELEREIINLDRADTTVKKEIEIKEKKYDEKAARTKLNMCTEAVNSVTGNRPQFTLPEYINIMGDRQLDLTREQITDFTRKFVHHYRRNPTLKEVIYHARIG